MQADLQQWTKIYVRRAETHAQTSLARLEFVNGIAGAGMSECGR
jgi:hypothetical protein